LEALRIQQSVIFRDWEVILVDNNSSDDTVAVTSAAFRDFPCSARVVRESRQGLSFARKTACDNANGEVIAYIDDDNVVAPDWVSQCVSFFEIHPMAGVVGGKVLARCDGPLPSCWSKIKWMLAVRDDMGDVSRRLAPASPVTEVEIPCGAGMVVRRKVLEEVYSKYSLSLSGRRGRSLSSGEDIEIGLRIVGLGWESWYCPDMVLWHIIPQSRLTDDYLCRLRYGIVKSCSVTDSISQYGVYPPPLKEAFRHLWWASCLLFRRLPSLCKRGFDSGILRAALLGRAHGAMAEVWVALMKRSDMGRN